MKNIINKFAKCAFLLACFITKSNGDIHREWKSTKSPKVIEAKVIDKHLEKNVWKCHLVLKSTSKGVWVKIDELSKADQDYLSKWITHEDRLVDKSGKISVKKSTEGQILKVFGKIGDKPETLEVPAFEEGEEEIFSTAIRISDVEAKTIRIELYSLDGSFIARWSRGS
jgi:hypothetical protein